MTLTRKKRGFQFLAFVLQVLFFSLVVQTAMAQQPPPPPDLPSEKEGDMIEIIHLPTPGDDVIFEAVSESTTIVFISTERTRFAIDDMPLPPFDEAIIDPEWV